MQRAEIQDRTLHTTRYRDLDRFRFRLSFFEEGLLERLFFFLLFLSFDLDRVRRLEDLDRDRLRDEDGLRERLFFFFVFFSFELLLLRFFLSFLGVLDRLAFFELIEKKRTHIK